jgi:RNA polymerase primary sigma factor
MAGLRQLKITKQITTRDSLSLNKYLSEISSLPMMTAEEEKEVAILIAKGDEKSLEKLIKSNLRFVVSVAKQHQNSGESLDELVSAGNIGLIEAAKRFDHTRGFKFISYAVWWIRQAILQYITENSKTIRLPSNKINSINKVNNVSSYLEQMYQRTPTVEEILEAVNERHPKDKMTEESVTEILVLSRNAIAHLDAPFSQGNSEREVGTLNDVLAGESFGVLEKDSDSNDLKIKIQEVLEKLSPKERKIIVSLYGLEGTTEKSLAEIGEELELTRERVRQIKEKIIRRLRYKNQTKILKEYL